MKYKKTAEQRYLYIVGCYKIERFLIMLILHKRKYKSARNIIITQENKKYQLLIINKYQDPRSQKSKIQFGKNTDVYKITN